MLLPAWALLVAVLLGDSTQEVTVVLAPQAPLVAAGSVTIVAVSEGETELSIPASPKDGEAQLRLSTDQAWRITCNSHEFWCPEIEIPSKSSGPEISGQLVSLPVMSRVLLRGKIKAAHPGKLPANLHLQAWAELKGSSEPLSFQLSVPVNEGQFQLTGPALNLDLRIAAEGFSPAYFWTVPAHGKSTLDLESVTLKPGNSLCGFVHDDASGRPLESAEIVLRVPHQTIGFPTKSVQRLRRMTWATKTNARGFYQIIGPPYGNYSLEVRSSDPEHQVLVVDSVGILAGAETCLDDLTMRRAIEVSFSISLPKAPSGKPWLAQLKPRDTTNGFVDPASTIPLDDAGRASFLVSPGVHNLSVFGDNQATMELLDRTFELTDPMEIPLTVDVLEVEGSIRLGEEPVVAQIRVWVIEGAFTTFESDYEGNFNGLIRTPPKAPLVAEITAVYPSFSRWVEINELNIEEGVLQLDFNFDDRSLEGKVTDEKGTPVVKAEVSVVSIDSSMPVSAKTGRDGRFLITGLAEEPYRVFARHRQIGTSEGVRVDPWGEGTGPELHLVLHRGGRTIQGRLLSEKLNPVSGALVRFFVPNGRKASTGMDGRFDFRVPEETRQAVALVIAPSQVIWTACVELPPDQSEVELQLPALPGGRLIIELPKDKTLGPRNQLAILSANGGVFTLTNLASWVDLSFSQDIPGYAAETRTITIPNLAAGLYSVIWTSGQNLMAQSCSGAFSASNWQRLAPGGELLLDDLTRPSSDRDKSDVIP